jgi:hypothetical protein
VKPAKVKFYPYSKPTPFGTNGLAHFEGPGGFTQTTLLTDRQVEAIALALGLPFEVIEPS